MDDPRTITMDLSGLTRLFGDARTIGEALGRAAVNHGLRVRLAIAGTRTAARLLAHANGAPLTVVDPGDEAAALARLPIELLAVLGHDAPQPSYRRTLASSNTPSQRRILAPSERC